MELNPKKIEVAVVLGAAALLPAVVAVVNASRIRARSIAIEFDGGRAFRDLQNIVKLGPRPPASGALVKARQYLRSSLAADGIEVWEDAFMAATPAGRVPMANLIGVIPGASRSGIIIAGHYETARLDRTYFVGANDGGSSAAFLLEMARVLKNRNHAPTFWLVFFDGEEALQQWTSSDSLYGSRHLAKGWEAEGRLKDVLALLLVDMVADRHLNILRESSSTPWLTDLVFKNAVQLGYRTSFEGGRYAVEDDHLPFLERGVPAVDIIDVTPFESYHHTARDTLDRCSARSLEVIGRVVLASVAGIEKWSQEKKRGKANSTFEKPKPAVGAMR